MAQVTVQSDFMTQTLAAQPVGSNTAFCVVQDANTQPLVFSIGDEGQMYLTLTGPAPRNDNVLVPLNAKFNIASTSSITTLITSQSPSGSIYLVFAEHFSAPRNDAIHLVQVQNPATIDWINSTDLTSYLVKDLSSTTPEIANNVVTVQSFFLGDNSDNQGFPFLGLTYIDPHSHTQLTSIQLSADYSGWVYSANVVLPEEADPATTTVTPTSINGARGLTSLYTVGGTQKLAFMGFYNGFQVQAIHEQPDLIASSLSAYSDNNGDSVIMLGAADGLHYYSPPAAITSSGSPTLLSADPAVLGASELYTTTSDNCTTIWLVNANQEVVYHQIDSNMNPITPPTVLLDATTGGRFAPLFDASSNSQQIFSLNQAQQSMTILNQSGGSRLWSQTPYALPSTGVTYDFTSYSAHVSIVGADGLPIPSTAAAPAKVQLSSSSSVNIIANGNSFSIDQTGQAVPLGSDGTITVLIPTGDIASPYLYVTDVPSAPTPYFGGQTITIDPAHKVKDGLSSVTDGPSLQAQAGQYIPGSPSPAALSLAGTSIGQLHSKAQDLTAASTMARHVSFPKPGSKRCSEKEPHPRHHGRKHKPVHHNRKQKPIGSAKTMAWDAWHAFETGLKKVDSFSMKVVEEALCISLMVLGEEFLFELTEAEYCYKAVAWILKTFLGIQLPDIFAWLGFLFEWSDITDTQKILVQAFNAMIDAQIQEIAEIEGQVDGWLENLETRVNNSFNQSIPPATAAITSSQSGITTTANSDPTSTAARTSPGANWLNYQMSCSSAGPSLMHAGGTSSLGGGLKDDPVADLLGTIEGAFNPLKPLVQSTLIALGPIFAGEFTVGGAKTQMQATLQQLVDQCINALMTVVNGALDKVADILGLFKTLANAQLLEDIPLFSSLWKVIDAGQTFSLIDIVGLLLALPVTVITKGVTGKAPSQLPAWTKLENLLAAVQVKENAKKAPVRNSLSSNKSRCTASILTVSQHNQGSSYHGHPHHPQQHKPLGDAESSFSALVDATGELIEIGEPAAGGLASITASLLDWYEPGALGSKFTNVMGFLIALLGCPTDIGAPVRPAFTWRALESTMDFVDVFLVATVSEKQARAFMMGVAAVIRAIFTTVSGIEDLTASTTEYPELDFDTLWLEETCRWIDVVVELADCVALGFDGVEPYSAGTYAVSSFVVIAGESYNAAKKFSDGDYENAVDVPAIGEPV